MSSFNQVTLVGNLTRDVDVRYTSDNKPIANITLATSEKWKDHSGQQQERTEFHRVVVFGSLADVCGKYLKKGSKAMFQGKLQTRKWQGQDGKDVYTTEVIVDMRGELVMLGGGNVNGERKAEAKSEKPAAQSQQEEFDDTIPFD